MTCKINVVIEMYGKINLDDMIIYYTVLINPMITDILYINIDIFQVIFDYITTMGFNQRRYTIATTYPRQLLTEERELTLSELEFTKCTTLNIEEIEE